MGVATLEALPALPRRPTRRGLARPIARDPPFLARASAVC